MAVVYFWLFRLSTFPVKYSEVRLRLPTAKDSCQVTAGPNNTPIFVCVRSRWGQKMNQFLFVSGAKKYFNVCSCQVTAGQKKTSFFVRVRSRRGDKILNFLFVSGHGGAKKYSIFCSCQVMAGPKNTSIFVRGRSRRDQKIRRRAGRPGP